MFILVISYKKTTQNLRLRVVTFYRSSKRVADSEMAAVKFKANGLMRAVESVFASSNRRGVPVTVQLIYFSMRQSGRSYFVNLGGTAGIYILSQLLGQDFFYFYLE